MNSSKRRGKQPKVNIFAIVNGVLRAYSRLQTHRPRSTADALELHDAVAALHKAIDNIEESNEKLASDQLRNEKIKKASFDSENEPKERDRTRLSILNKSHVQLIRAGAQ